MDSYDENYPIHQSLTSEVSHIVRDGRHKGWLGDDQNLSYSSSEEVQLDDKDLSSSL